MHEYVLDNLAQDTDELAYQLGVSSSTSVRKTGELGVKMLFAPNQQPATEKPEPQESVKQDLPQANDGETIFEVQPGQSATDLIAQLSVAQGLSHTELADIALKIGLAEDHIEPGNEIAFDVSENGEILGYQVYEIELDDDQVVEQSIQPKSEKTTPATTQQYSARHTELQVVAGY